MADNKFIQERRNDPFTLGSGVKAHTPANTDLPPETKAVFLGETGTVDVTNADGTTAAGVPATGGALLPFVPKRITAATAAVYLVI